MKFTATRLPDVVIIEPAVFGDARGFFYETWNAARFAEYGLPTNFVQSNVSTSAKGVLVDHLGREQRVMWVKGSGGDVGSIRMDGFATLYMDKLRALKGVYKGVHMEDAMVGYLPHCTFNLNARAASIDTPLHAYVPRAHVDHMHPDAIIAIAASAAEPPFANISAPAAVARGSADVATASDRAVVGTTIRTGRVVIIPNAGHYVPFEQPASLNKLVFQFLNN